MIISIKGNHIRLSPTQILVLGLAFIIIVSSFLFCLPIASSDGKSMGFVNAFFQATSAVCVTGLTVVNTADGLSLFGQLLTLILIQIGGLGFMTMATMVFLMFGKRITLRERLVIQEALNQFSLAGVVSLTRSIILATFFIEGLGALLLTIRFIPLFGWGRGIYYSVFHAVSAFCNAGFDLLGNSFVEYTEDVVVNLTLAFLIVSGGLGFTVMLDIYRNGYHVKKWSLHTKVVISMTTLLILGAFVFFLAVEFNNTLGPYGIFGKVLGAFFHSVTIRTAGFSTIPMDRLTDGSKFFMIILMFIGASPASTGGGIKTVTAALVILMVVSVIRGREDIEIFRKRIPHDLASRALAIFFISIGMLILLTVLLTFFESESFIDLMLYAEAALSTVGMATFDSGRLADVSKIFTIFAMFIGRVGPLTLTIALARRQSRKKAGIKYPEDRLMVG